MKSKEICFQLLAAESEKEVQSIIEGAPELRKASNWRPLDNRETNFNVTSNQASDGGKALTELMTNMVDAILLKRAYERGIDPKGPRAPATMYEAVEKLVGNVPGGRLSTLPANDSWLKKFGLQNLVIGVTGAKNRKLGLPCYTFVDNGEGQPAERFEGTFLSLSAGNKKDIAFVQGKYNMGSSGVLGYCGFQGYKLAPDPVPKPCRRALRAPSRARSLATTAPFETMRALFSSVHHYVDWPQHAPPDRAGR